MRRALLKARNRILHVVFLVLVFITALYGFERLINQAAPVIVEGMQSSTFPLVYMQNNGVSYNCLHGYAEEMDVTQIRDTVTILPADHTLQIQIQPFDAGVEEVSYEVITLDGAETLENTTVVKMTEEGGYLYATLQLQNSMRMEQEYMFKLRVNAGGRDIYFYTRLILEDGLHLSAYLDFVTGFYEKCVNRSDETGLGTYVEPDESSGNETTLASMDIHAAVNQLMWGELYPQIYYKPTPSLVDINKTTASFVLEYRISSVGETGITEIYNVKEFYRLRYTDTRIFLLDFTRTTDELFSPERNVLVDNGLNLGITGMDVEYMFDENKRVAAFVQENELWTYQYRENKLTRIFGFPQSENMDYRDFYDKNDIRILRVNAEGDVWFAVSGYMNRGVHEGENGVGIYYFEDASASVEELAFARTMEAYDLLKLDLDALSYITLNGNYAYLFVDETLHRVDLYDGSWAAVASGVRNDCFAGSDGGRFFAWLEEGERFTSKTLHVIDMETGNIRDIQAGDGDYIRPVCFMGEDLIYGYAHETDLDLAHAGSEVFPMYRLEIENPAGESIKTYEPTGIFVRSVCEEDNMLTLDRVVRTKTGYAATAEDHIVSTDVEDAVRYGLSTRVTDKRQTEIILRVGNVDTSDNPQTVICRIVSTADSKTVTLPAAEDQESLYYVYAGGVMDSFFNDAASAVRRADETVGVVINEEKAFVWERGNRTTTKRMKPEEVPPAFLAGTMDIAQLEEQMDTEVLDLKGCTLDMVLYFVGQGRAVLAATPTGMVTIVGYDEYNVILMDPGSDETYYGGLNDSTAMFEDANNAFLSYMN